MSGVGAQKFSRRIQAILLTDTHDLDIENSLFTLIWQLLAKLDLEPQMPQEARDALQACFEDRRGGARRNCRYPLAKANTCLCPLFMVLLFRRNSSSKISCMICRKRQTIASGLQHLACAKYTNNFWKMEAKRTRKHLCWRTCISYVKMLSCPLGPNFSKKVSTRSICRYTTMAFGYPLHQEFQWMSCVGAVKPTLLQRQASTFVFERKNIGLF